MRKRFDAARKMIFAADAGRENGSLRREPLARRAAPYGNLISAGLKLSQQWPALRLVKSSALTLRKNVLSLSRSRLACSFQKVHGSAYTFFASPLRDS